MLLHRLHDGLLLLSDLLLIDLLLQLRDHLLLLPDLLSDRDLLLLHRSSAGQGHDLSGCSVLLNGHHLSGCGELLNSNDLLSVLLLRNLLLHHRLSLSDTHLLLLLLLYSTVCQLLLRDGLLRLLLDLIVPNRIDRGADQRLGSSTETTNTTINKR